MKYVVEFGVRGGAHVDNLIVPTQKLAKELAQHLVMVFTNDPHCDQFRDYAKGRRIMRASWTSSTHFVSVSPLDGTMRGLELQELQLSLSKKNVAAAQAVAHITQQNYADRLLAATRQATMAEETP